MNRHERYNKSEKGLLRNRRYKDSEKGKINETNHIYARMRNRLRIGITNKQQKIAELERILQDAEKI